MKEASAMRHQPQKHNKHNLDSILKMIELKIVGEQQRTASDDSLERNRVHSNRQHRQQPKAAVCRNIRRL